MYYADFISATLKHIKNRPVLVFVDNLPFDDFIAIPIREYLKNHPEFEIDKSIQHKLLITVAPDGYLKRVR